MVSTYHTLSFFYVTHKKCILTIFHISHIRVSVGITVHAPVTAVSNKTNYIQCFKDIERYRTIENN